MIGIPLGLLAANAGEWAIHKYVLHGLGCKKDSFWSYHWHEHHRTVRKNQHVDPLYHKTVAQCVREWNGQGKEAVGLLAGAALIAPLFPVAPFFVGTLWYSMQKYYRIHKRAHLDTEWARANVPWHYDHHMGPDQHKNWCVTHPLFDDLLGTRAPYAGTTRELEDQHKRERLARRRDGAS